MASIPSQRRLYKQIVDMLELAHLDRRDIISRCVAAAGLSPSEMSDKNAGSPQNNIRSRAGGVLNDMEARGLIALDEDELYYLVSAKPVVIRIERCEKELIRALTERPMTKSEIRDRLKSIFGTDKTPTTRDDDTLFTFMGQTLKKLQASGIIALKENYYSLSPKAHAKADDLNEMLTLKNDFLAKVHSRGGEFFENYFMALLKKYTEKCGKRVLECYVTGGSADGGIDGVMKTEDQLGFREVTMVQTKNRTDIVSETAVRGFYGAVCAQRGTRGIFATTSDFHSSALDFTVPLDDCVTVNGTRLFKMAIEASYGIKKIDGEYAIDEKIFG